MFNYWRQTLFAIVLTSQITQAKVQICTNGLAGEFPCSNIDLMAKMDLTKNGIFSSGGNDIWGWTDPQSGREYAIMGLTDKTSFVDITVPTQPTLIADLPTQSRSSTWRDMKVYKDHAYIVSEAWAHGLQVFDLRRLPALAEKNKPQLVQADTIYKNFSRAHNIAINEDSGFAYIVGSNTCDAGVHVVDIRKPGQPQFSTCIGRDIFEGVGKTDASFHGGDGDTYTHDIQCVNYHGPDLAYQNREICIASNADTVNIVDVTDKANPVQLSVMTYEKVRYVHQGWLTEDHKYFLLGDELDESGHRQNTRTHLIDLSNLHNMKYMGFHEHSTKAIDHNLYILGNHAYMANYKAGLRIFDIGQVTTGVLKEIAFFDIYPEDDKAGFKGAWSVYPYFSSGNTIISGTNGTLYIVRPQLKNSKEGDLN